MPEDNKLHNSKVIKTYVDLIEERYPHIDVDELLKKSAITYEQIKDPDVWFTKDQVTMFHKAVQDENNGNGLAREAGQYALDKHKKSMGIFNTYLFSLGSPANVYKQAKKFSERIDRSTIYEINLINKNTAEIIAKPIAGDIPQLFQCENRFGNIEKVPEQCGCELKSLDHPKCIFKGYDICQYIVSWKEKKSHLFKRLRNFLIPIIFIAAIISLFILPSELNYIFSIIFISVGFSFGWYVEYIKKKELKYDLNFLSNDLDQNMTTSNVIYQISEMIKKIGHAVSSASNINENLEAILSVVEKHADYDRGLILLEDTYKNRLEYKDGFGYSTDDLNKLRRAEIYLNRPKYYDVIFVKAFKDKQTYVENMLKDNNVLSIDEELTDILFAESFICCPIIHKGESIGVFAVFYIEKRRDMAQRDINLLEGIAPTIGLAISDALKRISI